MTTIPYRIALIVGAGSGISASVARGLAAAGLKVGLAARNIDKLGPLAAEIEAERFAVDASDPAAVAHLFEEADARIGVPDVVLYNASSTRKRCGRRSRYRPLAGFWSSSRPPGA
jgi:NADP-dependent 3-hydroxy acid dehydrogenase YdfG